MGSINRREFLALMGLTTYGLLTGSCELGGLSDGGDSGNGNSSQPLFKNPAEINGNRNGNILDVNLTVKETQVEIDQYNVRMLTYNGLYPAPTIRVKSGDILKVNFKNEIPVSIGSNINGYDMSITNLHTHGFHVSPTGNSDNIFLNINSGETFSYEYNLSKQWGGFMGFYHPHKHGTVAEQMWRGISGGALIVEYETTVLNDFEEKIMVLSDVSVSGGEPTYWSRMDYMRSLGDIVMVNGLVNPVLEIKAGQVQRWRIVNSSVYRIYRLSLEGHKLYLVGTDSNILDKPVELDEIIMAPGERIDVLVKADKSGGSYKLKSKPVFDADERTILTVVYSGVSTQESIPFVIFSDVANRVKVLRSMDLSSLRNVDMTLSFVSGMGSGGGMKGAINGGVFGENTYVLESQVGTYEIWTVYNQTGMPHPFHHHVDASVVLEISGGGEFSDYGKLYTSINAFKDTVIVPPHGYVKLLVPVDDFSGETVFHCHILGHEDIGMMGKWRRV